MCKSIRNIFQYIKKFLITNKNNAIIINIILLLILIFIDILRIFDSDLNIAYGFIYQVYLSPLFISTMALSCLIVIGIDFILEKKFAYKIISSKKSLIITMVSICASPLIFILLAFFSDHRSDISYTALYGVIAYIFGLFTPCLYYLFVEKIYPYIISREWTFIYNLLLLFFIVSIFIMVLSTINSLGLINNLKEIPLFTVMYSLLGSFLGSELCNLYNARKKNTK